MVASSGALPLRATATQRSGVNPGERFSQHHRWHVAEGRGGARRHASPVAAPWGGACMTAALMSFNIEAGTRLRNRRWNGHPLIPSWVDVHKVGLDQFYTRSDVAERCYRSLLAVMQDDAAPLDEYTYIDPGAGQGAFFDLLPHGRRLGVDVAPTRPDFVCEDFLSWTPDGRRLAVVGNPPFGYRAWLALAFVNHAATFADYVGLILPMAFQSDGKGSPKHRVIGLRLIHTETTTPLASRTTRRNCTIPTLVLSAIRLASVTSLLNLPISASTFVAVFFVSLTTHCKSPTDVVTVATSPVRS